MSARKKDSEQLTKLKEIFEKNGYIFVSVVPLESASYVEARTPTGLPVIVKSQGLDVQSPAYRPSTTKRIPEALYKIGNEETNYLTGVAIQHPETYYIKYGNEELNFSPKSTSTDQYKTVRVLPVVTQEELRDHPEDTLSNIDRASVYMLSEFIKYMEDNMNNFSRLIEEDILTPAADYFKMYDSKIAKAIKEMRALKNDIKQGPDDKLVKDFMAEHKKLETIVHHAYEVGMMVEALNGMMGKFNSMYKEL